MENKDYVAARRRKLKQLIVQYMGGSCHRCGWNEHPSGLVPHHVDPKSKSFSLSAAGKTLKWETLKLECDKCILLCSNCHSVIHATNESFYFDPRNIPVYENLVDPDAIIPKKNFYCLDCNVQVSYLAQRCRSCAARKSASHKIDWPELSDLRDMVAQFGYSGTGRKLGVSDNAVRKHLAVAQGFEPRLSE